MGGKHTKIDLLIENSLENGIKTGSELYITVLQKNPHENKEEIDKTRKAFIYALNKLLEEGKIQIVSYKKRNLKPKQSFNFDPFIFELAGKDEGEVLLLLNTLMGDTVKNVNHLVFELVKEEGQDKLHLLNQLKDHQDHDVKNIKTARNQLLNCFKHKVEQLYEKELNNYNKFKDKIDLITLKDWINEMIVEIEENEVEEKKEKYDRNDTRNVKIRSIIRWYVRNLENMQKSYAKNGDRDIWRFKIKELTLEEMDKINVIVPTLEENEFPNVESFLEAKGINKPLQRNFKEIRRQFREILFFILSENNKLKNYFSLALSNDKESLAWFEKFIQHDYTKYTEGELSDLLDKTEYSNSEKEKRFRLKKQLENMGKE